MRKNCTNQRKTLKVDTFSAGGGGTTVLWTKRFYGHLGVSDFCCGISFVGITEKIGNVVTGNNFGGVRCHGITENFGRVSAQCEAM